MRHFVYDWHLPCCQYMKTCSHVSSIQKWCMVTGRVVRHAVAGSGRRIGVSQVRGQGSGVRGSWLSSSIWYEAILSKLSFTLLPVHGDMCSCLLHTKTIFICCFDFYALVHGNAHNPQRAEKFSCPIWGRSHDIQTVETSPIARSQQNHICIQTYTRIYILACIHIHGTWN